MSKETRFSVRRNGGEILIRVTFPLEAMAVRFCSLMADALGQVMETLESEWPDDGGDRDV